MVDESLWSRIGARLKSAYTIPVTANPAATDTTLPAASKPAASGRVLIEVLQARFEGREAIYVEKGALRVRVSNIRRSGGGNFVWVDVEEIPTSGLGVGMFETHRPAGRNPLRWRISAGYLSDFSDQWWAMGYGGWSLHFDPKFVQAVVDAAARFTDDLDPGQRCEKVMHCSRETDRGGYLNVQPVFPDAQR